MKIVNFYNTFLDERKEKGKNRQGLNKKNTCNFKEMS